MWRSTAWLMSFTLVIEGMNIVAFIVILAGGPVKRMNGWRMLGVLLLLNGMCNKSRRLWWQISISNVDCQRSYKVLRPRWCSIYMITMIDSLWDGA